MLKVLKNTARQVLRNWLATNDCDEKEYLGRADEDRSIKRERARRGLTFSVSHASGGIIIDIEKYNPNGPNEYTAHVISTDADLGAALRDVITIEMLRM